MAILRLSQFRAGMLFPLIALVVHPALRRVRPVAVVHVYPFFGVLGPYQKQRAACEKGSLPRMGLVNVCPLILARTKE